MGGWVGGRGLGTYCLQDRISGIEEIQVALGVPGWVERWVGGWVGDLFSSSSSF